MFRKLRHGEYKKNETECFTIKNTLGWINGKLDIAEERICELKHIKELFKIKHKEKFKNLIYKQNINELFNSKLHNICASGVLRSGKNI